MKFLLSRSDPDHDFKSSNLEALIARCGGRIYGQDWLGDEHAIWVDLQACDDDQISLLKTFSEW